MKIIYRDFSRTEEDDFKLKVSLEAYEEAVPLYRWDTGEIFGWRIKPIGE